MKVLLASIVALGLIALPMVAQAQEGLVAYWPLNEGTGDTTADATGNGHDGTLNGNPQWVEGVFGGALEFDGTGDEVNVPFDAALNPENSFTICVWANVEPGSGGHRAPVSCRDDLPQRGYIIYAEPGNTWQYWIGAGGWNQVQGPDVNLGEWTHLAAVYSEGTQQFYVDGVLAGESEKQLEPNTTQVFLIGAGANERAVHEYLFVGMVDDVRLYNQALTEAEVQLVMQSEVAAVEPSDKLAVSWGVLKSN